MKTIAFVLAAAAVLGAENQPSQTSQAAAATQSRQARKSAAAQTPKPAASGGASSQTPSVPRGAVEVGPNMYRYTDAQGKTWMYRQTPFGLSKWEDVPAPQPVVEDSNPVVITDLGDSVQFERQTPVGTSKWTHKKTELTADEKAWMDRQRAKQQSAPAASDSAPSSSTATGKR